MVFKGLQCEARWFWIKPMVGFNLTSAPTSKKTWDPRLRAQPAQMIFVSYEVWCIQIHDPL